MIRPALIFLSVATVVLFSACEPDQDQGPLQRHKYGYDGETPPTEVLPPDTEPGATPPGDVAEPGNTGPIAPTPPPPPPPAPDTGISTTGTSGAPEKSGDYPYAQPVPNKPGFVISPYAPGSGYVDVRGFPPGTEVKDPYTQKVFLVP